jgi:predicted ATPase
MEAALPAAQAHPLIGRTRELDALTRAIEGGARLLTVTGPGGVGKTRLVAEALAGLRASHADMVPSIEVDLGDVETVGGLVDRVIDALGGSGRQRDLGKLLAQRAPVVLVLDPFDRLVGAGAILSEWLRAVPSLALVVVSRQVLRSPEEVVVEVQPIADEAAGVALFEAIARRHRPGFALGEADRTVAAAIVRELDGLPLAIELAASRMSVMSPPALLHRLRNRFEVLRRAGGEAGRHVTLEASIAWSVELLGPVARDALAQCTVFRGGFSIEAAEAVIALDGTPVLDVLQSLRERSLLTASEPSGPRGSDELRLHLGASVRAFVEPSLSREAREAAEDRHATFFVRSAEAWAAASGSRDGWRARARIAAERDNLLAVVQRILGRPNVSSRSADRALRALVALGPVLLREGALEIIAQHLERGLAVAQGSGADPRLQARSLALRADVAKRTGDLAAAEKDLAEAMVLAHHTGETAVEARALVLAATIATGRRDRVRAEAVLDRAETLARGLGDELLSLAILGARGALHLHARDLAGAETAFEEGLARARRAGDPAAEIAFARRLAYLDLAQLRPTTARERLEAARGLARDAHEPRAEVLCGAPLAVAMALETGASDRYAAPVALCVETARRAAEHGLAGLGAVVEGILGCLHAARGERGEARLLLSEATATEPATRPADLDLLFLLALARLDAQAQRREAARKLVQRALGLGEAAIDGALVAFLAEDPLALDSAHVSPLVSLLLAIPSTSVPLASVPPPDARQALSVGPGGTWFRVASEPRVDLSRRKPLRLILERLCEERAAGGGTLGWDDLLAAGWPGERMRADAGAHRVRVAISTLRKMGLRDVLRTEEEGYRLDPGFEVVRAG